MQSNTAAYYRARTQAIGEALAYELSLPKSREQEMRIAYLRNGHVPDRFLREGTSQYNYKLEEVGTQSSSKSKTSGIFFFPSIDQRAKELSVKLSDTPLTELELHTYDTFFQLHPEKVCGKQQGGSGYSFPVRTIGSRADIETAIDSTLKSPLQREDAGKRRGQGDEKNVEIIEKTQPQLNLNLYKYKAKAIAVKLAMEAKALGKVVKNENGLFTEIDVTLKKEYIPELVGKNAAITNSNMAFDYITKAFKYLNYKEEVIVLLLNLRNNIIGWHNLSKGGVKSSIIDIPQLIGVVGKSNATGVIMAHNHPSGSLVPSPADIASTQKVKETLKQMDVVLLDHVIVAQEVNEKNPATKYYSLAEHDQL